MKLHSFVRLKLDAYPNNRIIGISNILGGKIHYGNPYVEDVIEISGKHKKSLIAQEGERKKIIRKYGRILKPFGGTVGFMIECEYFKYLPDTALHRMADKYNLSVEYWFSPVFKD